LISGLMVDQSAADWYQFATPKTYRAAAGSANGVVNVEVAGPTAVTATISRLDGTSAQTVTGTGSLRLSYTSGGGEEYRLQIQAAPSVSVAYSLRFSADSQTGDYDRDGVVGTPDYNLWRASFGQTVSPQSGADGNGNGVIDAADYVVWRRAFSLAAASAIAASVRGDDAQAHDGRIEPTAVEQRTTLVTATNSSPAVATRGRAPSDAVQSWFDALDQSISTLPDVPLRGVAEARGFVPDRRDDWLLARQLVWAPDDERSGEWWSEMRVDRIIGSAGSFENAVDDLFAAIGRDVETSLSRLPV
jgi:hypothetical protein